MHFATPFGTVIVASTDKGICHMSFADEGEETALASLKSAFPHAAYRHFTDTKQQNALSVFPQDWSKLDEIKLHLKGTDFQSPKRIRHFVRNDTGLFF